MPKNTAPSQKFGGDWTIEKLNVVEAYCDAYTTALKRAPSPTRPFRLHFIDAFAGTGYVDIKSGKQAGQRVEGSAIRALAVTDRPFDQVHLIEIDTSKAKELNRTVADHRQRVNIIIGDANDEVVKICNKFSRSDRAVVLFDPASTQLDWSTVKLAAETGKCDIWILFPLGDVRRDLGRSVRPEKDSADGQRLTRVLGTDTWYDRYSFVAASDPAEQIGLGLDLAEPIILGSDHWESPQGTDWVLDIYRESLERIFPAELVLSRELTNSRNSAMFSLFFGCANPKGAQIANRIAAATIKKAEREAREIEKSEQNPSLFD